MLNYLPLHLGFSKGVLSIKTGHGKTGDAKPLKWELGKSKSAKVKSDLLVRKKQKALMKKIIGILFIL